MSAEGSVKEEEELQPIFEVEIVSSEELPPEEWSSILCWLQAPQQNLKRALFDQGLYTPPAEEICAKYIPLSDSSVFRHPYYNYPSLKDPGIENALLQPPPRIIYPDDGKELYLDLCKEMNESPCRRFCRQLLEDTINISYYGVSPMGFRPMAMALRHNRHVNTVNLTDNFISNDGCFHFGDILDDNFTITELNFCGCRMGPEGLKNLTNKMHKNRTLRKINLSKNLLADEGAQYLAQTLYKGASVADINLSFNQLTSKTAGLLAEALEFSNNVTHLDLSWNSLSVPKQVEMLISCFMESDKLVEINLSWNSLNNRFAKALSNLLLVPNIQVINLSNNTLSGDAISMIGENLSTPKFLEVLDVSYNPLTAADAKLLLRYMRLRKVKLKKLLLDGVYVDEAFMTSRNHVLNLKFRKDAVITHGYVSPKVTGKPPDMRKLVLERAQNVCEKPKKKRIDVGLMILQVNKDLKGQPIGVKELQRLFKEYGAFQINNDLADELAAAFGGPRRGKFKLADIAAMADYVQRIWPETKLPPTPPPPVLTPPPPLPKKGKDKGKADKGKKGKK